MKAKFITLFPELIQSYLKDALISKAVAAGLLEFEVINLRDFSDNKYKSVDDAPFGGGDGMLLRADILEKAILTVLSPAKKQTVVYFSPQGALLTHETAKSFAASASDTEFIFICGRYAGIDQRFIDRYVHQEISVGDYILSGGELAALVFTETVSRFIPGVLGNLVSSDEDSFKDGLLEAPQFTRPQVWNELKVPEVLTSGDHAKIQKWKNEMALKVTSEKRPDLLVKKGKK